MPRITIKYLQESNEFLRKKCYSLEERLELHRREEEHLKGILKTYQGMTSLTVACERVCESLAHVISDIKRR
jgi:hypothetical protein